MHMYLTIRNHLMVHSKTEKKGKSEYALPKTCIFKNYILKNFTCTYFILKTNASSNKIFTIFEIHFIYFEKEKKIRFNACLIKNIIIKKFVMILYKFLFILKFINKLNNNNKNK